MFCAAYLRIYGSADFVAMAYGGGWAGGAVQIYAKESPGVGISFSFDSLSTMGIVDALGFDLDLDMGL